MDVDCDTIDLANHIGPNPCPHRSCQSTSSSSPFSLGDAGPLGSGTRPSSASPDLKDCPYVLSGEVPLPAEYWHLVRDQVHQS